jgi:hypothetical protein
MAPRLSVFQKYSIGIVAEHKDLQSKLVLVTPIEETPVMDGVLKSNPMVLETKGVDSSGNDYQTTAMTDTTVTATWLPDSANRITPPDVRRGTRVQLYRMADSDTFYWRDLGLDGHLKRLETCTLVFNNNPDAAGDDTIDPASSYFMEVSTHSGTATFATSKSNGEPLAWTIQVNAKEGSVSVVNDDNDEFTFDGVEKHIFAKLSTGTEFNLNQNNIYGFAPDTITLEAKKDITMICQNFSLTASKTYKCVTKDWFVDSPIGEFTGILKVGGLATSTARGFSGDATIDSALTVKKDFTAQANATVAAQLTATHITSPNNIDAPNV